MNTRRLGRTGLQVSEVGFGGEWLERHDEAHSVNLIRHAQNIPRFCHPGICDAAFLLEQTE